MQPPNTFHINHQHLHLNWSRDISPVIIVEQNKDVTFDLLECTGSQLTPSSTSASIASLDLSRCNPVFGPVSILGANPGDTLEVEFVRLETDSWGFACIIPGFGLLADEFPEPVLKHFSIPSGTKADIQFKDGISIPKRPFLGCCGVAPAEKGEFSTIAPLKSGGNLDCRYLTEGTKLFLPVSVPGALFSCGDGHAAQGDGEVCGTAIETSMKATLRFRVHRRPYVTSPHYDTSGAISSASLRRSMDNLGSYAVIGVHEDLREASRDAVRGLIAYLVAERELTREEAYILISVVADLKIIEAVDMPNYAVAASIPLSIFRE